MNPTNLFEYYQGQGKSLPSVQERAPLAQQAGITGVYTGTAEQNTQLLNFLKNPPSSQQPKQYPVVTSGPATDKTKLIQDTLNQGPAPKTPKESFTNENGTTTVKYTDGTSAILGEDGKPISTSQRDLYSTIAAIGEQSKQDQAAYDTYQSTISKIYSGDLTPSEQAQIDAIQKKYDQVKELQAISNKSTEGTATEFGNRLGLNVGSPLQAKGYVDVAINQGLMKIAAIQDLAETKKSEMRDAFMKNKLGLANDSYNAYAKLSERKMQAIKDTQEIASKYESDLRSYNLQVQKQKNDDEQLQIQKSNLENQTKKLTDDLLTGKAQRDKIYTDISKTKAEIKQLASTSNELTSKQIPIFNSLVDKYNKSPLVAANDRTVTLKAVSNQLSKDPTNSSLQVGFIYSLIQALDTYQSAVREGEISLVSGTSGVADKIRNLPDKIERGTIISTPRINEYIQVGKILTDAIEGGMKQKQTQFGTQADIAGIGPAFKQYTDSINSVEDKVKKDPETRFKELRSDPAYKTLIDKAMGEFPDYGPEEILQIIGK